MINKIKGMLSANKLARISCTAAGVITAGAIAFAVAGNPADDAEIAGIETDIIAEETTAASRTVSRDVEYFSEDDLSTMTAASQTEAAEEVTEVFTEAETEAEEEEIIPAAASEAVTEETAGPEDVAGEEADSAEEAEEAETETVQAEVTNEVSSYDLAAAGDDDDNQLSSILDMEVEEKVAAKPKANDFVSAEAPVETAVSTDGFVDPYFLYNKCAATTETRSVNARAVRSEGTSPADVEHISMLDIPQWLTLDENGVPVGYTKVLTGNACAYTADPGALMSTGKAVFQGYVAVDPDIIPYGTELYIVAEDGQVYGYAIAADTGGSVRRGVIIVDLFMNEYNDCIQWGNKPVNVYVLSSEE